MRTYTQREMNLVRKVGLLGTNDLRKLAPIGDIGYLNAIEFYRGDFIKSEIPRLIMNAFREQREKYGFTIVGIHSTCRGDSRSKCPELGLYWGVDSSD